MTLASFRRVAAVADSDLGCSPFATMGDSHARLLSGHRVREDLAAHHARLGALSNRPEPSGVLDVAVAAGIVGRGGGEFPLARKLKAALESPGEPILVVNGSESEPASRKDRLLLALRPHLVLDGADLAAAALGAKHIVVYLHANESSSQASVVAAVRERSRPGGATTVVTTGPTGFVTGESSAVVAALEGRRALPRPRAEPAAIRGVHGRPTVVSNVETLAQLALAFRFGAGWFAEAGSAQVPGSTLLTLAGGVASPGLVVESLVPATFSDLLSRFGSLSQPPRGVLLGGYGGRWVSGEAAWSAAVDRDLLKKAGVPLGCGLIAPLPHDACGLEVTARLLDYLAGQSARQCGSCLFGLPRLSALLRPIVEGVGGPRDVRLLREAAHTVDGRGGCAHPDGAVSLVETSLEVFASDLHAHLKGRHCGGGPTGWFPISRGPTGGHTR